LELAQIFASLDTAKRQAFVALNRHIDGMGRDEALALELVEIDRMRGIAASILSKTGGGT
jgi:hypothetical protein